MLPFLLPIFDDGGFIDRRLGRGLVLAMWGYDLAGGFRYGKLHDRLSKTEGQQAQVTAYRTRVGDAE